MLEIKSLWGKSASKSLGDITASLWAWYESKDKMDCSRKQLQEEKGIKREGGLFIYIWTLHKRETLFANQRPRIHIRIYNSYSVRRDSHSGGKSKGDRKMEWARKTHNLPEKIQIPKSAIIQAHITVIIYEFLNMTSNWNLLSCIKINPTELPVPYKMTNDE